jgi:hypothetical protein
MILNLVLLICVAGEWFTADVLELLKKKQQYEASPRTDADRERAADLVRRIYSKERVVRTELDDDRFRDQINRELCETVRQKIVETSNWDLHSYDVEIDVAESSCRPVLHQRWLNSTIVGELAKKKRDESWRRARAEEDAIKTRLVDALLELEVEGRTEASMKRMPISQDREAELERELCEQGYSWKPNMLWKDAFYTLSKLKPGPRVCKKSDTGVFCVFQEDLDKQEAEQKRWSQIIADAERQVDHTAKHAKLAEEEDAGSVFGIFQPWLRLAFSESSQETPNCDKFKLSGERID